MLYFDVMLKKYDICINADVLPKYPKISITVGSLLKYFIDKRKTDDVITILDLIYISV